MDAKLSPAGAALPVCRLLRSKPDGQVGAAQKAEGRMMNEEILNTPSQNQMAGKETAEDAET